MNAWISLEANSSTPSGNFFSGDPVPRTPCQRAEGPSELPLTLSLDLEAVLVMVCPQSSRQSLEDSSKQQPLRGCCL